MVTISFAVAIAFLPSVTLSENIQDISCEDPAATSPSAPSPQGLTDIVAALGENELSEEELVKQRVDRFQKTIAAVVSSEKPQWASVSLDLVRDEALSQRARLNLLGQIHRASKDEIKKPYPVADWLKIFESGLRERWRQENELVAISEEYKVDVDALDMLLRQVESLQSLPEAERARAVQATVATISDPTLAKIVGDATQSDFNSEALLRKMAERLKATSPLRNNLRDFVLNKRDALTSAERQKSESDLEKDWLALGLTKDDFVASLKIATAEKQKLETIDRMSGALEKWRDSKQTGNPLTLVNDLLHSRFSLPEIVELFPAAARPLISERKEGEPLTNFEETLAQTMKWSEQFLSLRTQFENFYGNIRPKLVQAKTADERKTMIAEVMSGLHFPSQIVINFVKSTLETREFLTDKDGQILEDAAKKSALLALFADETNQFFSTANDLILNKSAFMKKWVSDQEPLWRDLWGDLRPKARDLVETYFALAQETAIRNAIENDWYGKFHLRDDESLQQHIPRFQAHVKTILEASGLSFEWTPEVSAIVDSAFARIFVENRGSDFFGKEGLSLDIAKAPPEQRTVFDRLKFQYQQVESRVESARDPRVKNDERLTHLSFDEAIQKGRLSAASFVIGAFIAQNPNKSEAEILQHPAAQLIGREAALQSLFAVRVAPEISSYENELVSDGEVARLANEFGLAEFEDEAIDSKVKLAAENLILVRKRLDALALQFPSLKGAIEAQKQRSAEESRKIFFKWAFNGFNLSGLKRVKEFSCEAFPAVCKGLSEKTLKDFKYSADSFRYDLQAKPILTLAKQRGVEFGSAWYRKATHSVGMQKPLWDPPLDDERDWVVMAKYLDHPDFPGSGNEMIADARRHQVLARRANPLVDERLLTEEKKAYREAFVMEAMHGFISEFIVKPREQKRARVRVRKSGTFSLADEDTIDFDDLLKKAKERKIVGASSDPGVLMNEDEFRLKVLTYHVNYARDGELENLRSLVESSEVLRLAKALTSAGNERTNAQLYKAQADRLDLLRAVETFAPAPGSKPRHEWGQDRSAEEIAALKARWETLNLEELTALEASLGQEIQRTEERLFDRIRTIYDQYGKPLPGTTETKISSDIERTKLEASLFRAYAQRENGEWGPAYELKGQNLVDFLRARNHIFKNSDAWISMSDLFGVDPLADLSATVLRQNGYYLVQRYLGHLQDANERNFPFLAENIGGGKAVGLEKAADLLDSHLDKTDAAQPEMREIRNEIMKFAEAHPLQKYGPDELPLIDYWKQSLKDFRRGSIESFRQAEAVTMSQRAGVSYTQSLLSPSLGGLHNMLEASGYVGGAVLDYATADDDADLPTDPIARKEEIRRRNRDIGHMARNFEKYSNSTWGDSFLGTQKDFLTNGAFNDYLKIQARIPLSPAMFYMLSAGPAISSVSSIIMDGGRNGVAAWRDQSINDFETAAKNRGSSEYFIDKGLVGIQAGLGIGLMVLGGRSQGVSAMQQVWGATKFNAVMSGVGAIGQEWTEYNNAHRHLSYDSPTKSFWPNFTGDHLLGIGEKTFEGMAGSYFFMGGLNGIRGLGQRIAFSEAKQREGWRAAGIDPAAVEAEIASIRATMRRPGPVNMEVVLKRLKASGKVSNDQVVAAGGAHARKVQAFEARHHALATKADVWEGLPDFMTSVIKFGEAESWDDIGAMSFNAAASGMDLLDVAADVTRGNAFTPWLRQQAIGLDQRFGNPAYHTRELGRAVYNGGYIPFTRPYRNRGAGGGPTTGTSGPAAPSTPATNAATPPVLPTPPPPSSPAP